MNKAVLKREDRIKTALENILGGPLEPGTTIPATKFEEWFCLPYGSQTFGFLVSELRHALFSLGIYLSGEGFEQNKYYYIEDPRNHQWLAKVMMARAERSLDGMETLLLKTNMTKFSKLEKERHEATLRELSMKAKILRRIRNTEKIATPFSELSAAERSGAEPSTAEQSLAEPSPA